jgi:DHA2 family multidrug resistance protein
LQAYAIINGILAQQSRLRAYVDDFQYLAAVCFLCIPIVFLLRKAVARKGAVGAAH